MSYLILMQLQDAGCWTDAATLAASHLKGSDYARFLLFPYNICFCPHKLTLIYRNLIMLFFYMNAINTFM